MAAPSGTDRTTAGKAAEESSIPPSALPDVQVPGPSPATAPYLAVNSVDAVLPLGRTRGLLAVANGCVTFKVRDQLYTPVWPAGTRLSAENDRVIAPGGEVFPLGREVTLGGASFSLRNESMRLRERLPSRCPNATYAVNL